MGERLPLRKFARARIESVRLGAEGLSNDLATEGPHLQSKEAKGISASMKECTLESSRNFKREMQVA